MIIMVIFLLQIAFLRYEYHDFIFKLNFSKTSVILSTYSSKYGLSIFWFRSIIYSYPFALSLLDRYFQIYRNF